MPADHLEAIFPKLAQSHYTITSPLAMDYNCIAWAVGDLEKWWWPSPDSYWPPNLPRENTLVNFVLMFESRGYQTCETNELENGFEKIAIYISDDGKPTHAARQLISGLWTNKLGGLEDIEHHLGGLEGEAYGSVAQVMRHRLPGSIP